MEKNKLQPKKTPLTKEEVWRRMKEHKRKEQEFIRQMEEYLSTKNFA